MFEFLSKFFLKNQILLFSAVSLSRCRITKPYLLERTGISEGSVVMVAVPYFAEACMNEKRNLSCYAVSKDYHLFFKQLFDDLIPQLREQFPENRFAAFADHSPIAEVEAAATAGLGVIGKNHLLITESYSSFVFLGTLITDAKLPWNEHEIRACENCGACVSHCPFSAQYGLQCLSALTQKKGLLNEEEQKTIQACGSAWGCDLCQLVCPHTKKAIKDGTIFSPIPFFSEDPISHLTLDELESLTNEAFSARAFAWRGKETLRRNLILLQETEQKGDAYAKADLRNVGNGKK